jgi:hypothetical protein
MCIFDAPRAILAIEMAKLGSMKLDGKSGNDMSMFKHC